MNTVLIAATVLSGLLVALSLNTLVGLNRAVPMERRSRRVRARRGETLRPSDLVRTEQLVRDAVNGNGASARALAAHLDAVAAGRGLDGVTASAVSDLRGIQAVVERLSAQPAGAQRGGSAAAGKRSG